MSNPRDSHHAAAAAGGVPAPGAQVPASLPVVSAILATALAAAEKRASPGDVAHGVLAALRRLRATADEEAGDAMVAAIDAAIRQNLLTGGLTDRRGPATIAALPPVGPGAAAAAVIMESAAESCLAVNAHAPDNEPLEIAVNALTFQIGRHLGGAPGWEEVERELHRPLAHHGVGAILPAGAVIH